MVSPSFAIGSFKQMANRRRLAFETLIIVVTCLVFAVLLLWLGVAPDRWVYKKEFNESAVIIREAEAFRSSYGRVPDDAELALLMQKSGWKPSENCPCYRAISGSRYEVWFGYASLGTSMVYHSEGKTWGVEG
jgi:hypothetical protein